MIASRFNGVDLVTLDERNVGLARRAGAHQVLTGGGRASELWLASTDADSQVPANWLRRMLAEAQAGRSWCWAPFSLDPACAALHRDRLEPPSPARRPPARAWRQPGHSRRHLSGTGR